MLRFCVLVLLLDAFVSAQNPSPCPKIFDYAYSENGKIVGVMKILIPKENAQGFVVTQEFVPLQSSTRGIPKLELKGTQSQVINSILNGKEVEFETVFSAPTLNFKLVSVKLNDEELCSKSSFKSKSVVSVNLSFQPPKEKFASFENRFNLDLDSEKCGVQNAERRQNKPFNHLTFAGESLDWTRFPWAAAVYVSGTFKCSANLINDKTALTAAHCLDKDVRPQDIQLRLYNGRTASCKEFLNHEGLDGFSNDISLIFLTEKITDPDFSPVCIDKRSFDLTDVYGDFLFFSENELQQFSQISWLSMPTVSNEVCKNANQEILFCAGNPDATGPCDGDSGGGFYTQENLKWFLRGILSSGQRRRGSALCNSTDFSVFVDVQKFLPWITNDQTGVPTTSTSAPPTTVAPVPTTTAASVSITTPAPAPPTTAASSTLSSVTVKRPTPMTLQSCFSDKVPSSSKSVKSVDGSVVRRSPPKPLLFDNCGHIEDLGCKTDLNAETDRWTVYLHDRLDNYFYVIVPISPRWAINPVIAEINVRTPERYYVTVMNDGNELQVEKMVIHDKFNESSNNFFNMFLIKIQDPLPSNVQFFCVEKYLEDMHEKPLTGIWMHDGVQELKTDHSLTYGTCDQDFWVQENNFCSTYSKSDCKLITYEARSTPDGEKTYWAITGISAVYSKAIDGCLMISPSSYAGWIQDQIREDEKKLDEPALAQPECGGFRGASTNPDFSWVVQLHNRKTNKYSLAPLVTPNWIITRTQEEGPENFYVQTYGNQNKVEIEKIIGHEKYNKEESPTFRAIALMKLKESLANQKLFCLDQLATRFARPSISGLGREFEATQAASSVAVLTPEECAKESGFQLRYLYSGEFCGYEDSKGDNCTDVAFDSHMTDKGESYWSIVGVLSSTHVVSPGSDQKACFYTDVSFYVDWIIEKLQSN